jgi:hypothetical protein
MKLPFLFVPFPVEIWDKGIDLSKGEFQLLGWFLRLLKFGYQQGEYTDDVILKGNNGQLKPVGLSRNTFKQARDGLISKNFIEAHRTSDDPGRSKWIYRLVLSEIDPQVSEIDTGAVDPVSKIDTVIRKEQEKRKEQENPEAGLFVLDSPEKKKPKTDPGPTRADIDGYCDDIYGLYPKKIAPRAAKVAIEKAMRRLVNGENPGELKDLDDAYEWLFHRTEAYAKERHGQDEQFTPHPATWFNQGRYLDKQVKRA